MSKNNTSGFSIVPGGWRFTDGNFYAIGFFGNWWSTSVYDGSNMYCPTIFKDMPSFDDNNFGNKICGISIRLIRD